MNTQPASNRIPSIAGQRFGRLVALTEVEKNRHGARQWVCQCDCGAQKVVNQDLLRQGRTQSCGCLHREVASANATTHGGTGTSEHGIWRNMVNRCHLPTASNYENYGARGIRVAEVWRGPNGFERFLADVGPRPSSAHSLDRYPDVDGDYEPGNVRWATLREQARNKRNTLRVIWKGEELPLLTLTERLGLSYGTVRLRLRAGMSIEEAVAKPVRARRES